MAELMVRNIRRWRMRLLGIALLIALAFTLHVLYSGFLASSQNRRAQAMPELAMPFDVMIVVEPGERILSAAELPELPYTANRRNQVRVLDVMEPAVKLTVDSPVGAFALLGLQPDSTIYRAETLNLEGRWLENTGEIVLPRDLAEREGLKLGDAISVSAWNDHVLQSTLHYAAFTIVGIYDSYDLQPALVRYQDALPLSVGGEANCCLMTYLRNSRAQVGMDVTLEVFLDWIRPAYPNATFIEARLPEQISRDLLSRIYQPGQGLLWMVIVFLFVGVLTIAMMTYLERRKEIAALKTLGIDRRQMLLSFCAEYSLAALVGLALGGLLLGFLSVGMEWMQGLPALTMLRMIVVAALSCLLALVMAVLYPSTIALVATVNQLLYARRIPFRTLRLDHMQNPAGELVYREREENLRFLKTLPFEEAEGGLMLLKKVGDPVKRGEVVLLQERFFGYMMVEWSAFCDGTIAVVEPNGLVGIRPDDPDEGFYPYPPSLLEAEQRRRRILEDAALTVQETAEENARYSEGLAQALEEEQRHERAAQRQSSALRGESLELQRQSRVADYAAVARAEQRTAAPSRVSAWQRLRPLRWAVGCVLCYVALQQTFIYRNSLADMTKFRVTPVVLTNLRDTVQVQGLLQYRDDVAVRSEVDAQLTEILVSDGDTVASGQPLMRLSSPMVLMALEQARAEQAQAQRTYDTLRLQAETGGDPALQEQKLNVLYQQGLLTELQQKKEKLQLVAEENGIVTDIHSREGDSVSVGQPLFGFYGLQSESDAERELRWMQAHDTLETAERALQRLEIRAEHDGVVAEVRAVVGQSVLAGEALLSLTAEARALDEASQLALQYAEQEAETLRQQVERLTIVAPHDGLLSGFSAAKGDVIGSGALLGSVSGTNEYLARLQVPQHQIGGIRFGDKAEISVRKGQSYSGTVVEIAAAGGSDPTDRRVYFEVTVRFPAEGMLLGSKAQVTLLPVDAAMGSGSWEATLEAAQVSSLIGVAFSEVAEVRARDGDLLCAGDVIAILENKQLKLNLAIAETRVDEVRREQKNAPLQATVAQLAVRPGERVQAGQLLMVLEHALSEATYASALQSYQELQITRGVGRNLLSRGSGTVAEICVQEGEQVQAGQLLAVLRNPDLDYALAKAETELRKLEATQRALAQNTAAGAVEAARLRLRQANDALVRRERNAQASFLPRRQRASFIWTRRCAWATACAPGRRRCASVPSTAWSWYCPFRKQR